MEDGESGRSRAGHLGRSDWLAGDDPQPLAQVSTSHVDQIILLNQAGKNSHEQICESLKPFAKEMMPEFQAAEPEHQQWKQKVLAGEIELEEIDTAPFQSRFSENSVQLSPAKAAVGDD